MTHEATSSNRLLSVQGLAVSIPVASGMLEAVRGIDFHVDRGELLSIVGESGCGKSLTSLALMDLLPSKARRRAARMDFAGLDLTRIGPRQMASLRGDRIAMIFQEPMTSLNPCYTVGNQMTEVLRRHRKVNAQTARDRAVMLLARVGITGAAHRLDQYPHQLSGGLRQRVMIAMALMCEPELLIADEPTTALDVTIQAEILRLLRDLQKDTGLAVILITHDLGVVARVADRVAVMYAGQIVETGSAEALFAHPMHPYTKGLLACIPVPGRTKPGERLGSIPGLVPNLVGGIEGCAFYNRCPIALDACRGAIDARQGMDGHRALCLRATETVAA